MDDNNNGGMNDWQKDFADWWQGVMQEAEGRAEKMEAEDQMEYNNAWNDFSTEAEAWKDWTEADAKEFQGRVKQWWNSLEMKADEAV